MAQRNVRGMTLTRNKSDEVIQESLTRASVMIALLMVSLPICGRNHLYLVSRQCSPIQQNFQAHDPMPYHLVRRVCCQICCFNRWLALPSSASHRCRAELVLPCCCRSDMPWMRHKMLPQSPFAIFTRIAGNHAGHVPPTVSRVLNHRC
jgi:hypothetical protein